MKLIRDAVHGTIKLSDVELALLDTPQVQRLRRIKQLGFSYLVYPSATHTRFEHSLGAMHIAGLIAENIGVNNKLVRIAGLLHDVGHGPFSHTSEHVIERYANYKHENYTRKLIEKSIIKDILKEHGYEARDITSLLKKENPLGEIISSDMDADRMDYLVRDAYYTGVAYGVIDIERLIYTLKFHDKHIVLTGGTQAAEALLRARLLMYPTVYEHHTARIAESMFSKTVELALKEKEFTPDDFHSCDDVDVISRFRVSKGYKKDIITRIDNRDLFKRALVAGKNELSSLSINRLISLKENPSRVEKLENELAEECKLELGYVLIDIPEPIYLEESNLLVLVDDKLEELCEVSTSVKALMEEQWDYWNFAVYTLKEKIKEVRKEIPSIMDIEVVKTEQSKLV